MASQAGDDDVRLTVTTRLRIRQLQAADYTSNFIPLLQQLTVVGHISEDFFRLRLQQIVNDDKMLMIVVEDEDLGRICAAGTVTVESKFVHEAGLAGHLEDLVVDSGLRRKGVGRAIVEHLKDFARRSGCYKVILDCANENVSFYEKCGFKKKEASMVCYFDEPKTTANESSHAHWLGDAADRSEAVVSALHQSHSAALSSLFRTPYVFPDGLVFRRLCVEDYDSTFLALLSQLTTVGTVSRAAFAQRVAEVDKNPHQYVMVLVDDTGRIVGTGSLLIELKFIHSAGAAGHIEDIVVDTSIRGRGFGKKVVQRLKEMAREAGCYKAILDCAERNMGFYEKCGFKIGHSPVCMAHYFE